MVACVAGALTQLVMPLYFVHYSYVFAYDRADGELACETRATGRDSDASIPFKTPARTSKSGGSAGGSSGGSGCRSVGEKRASRRLLSPALPPFNLLLVEKIASDVKCDKAKAHAAVAIKAAEMAQAEASEAMDAADASDLAREKAVADAAVAEATTCKTAAAAKEAFAKEEEARAETEAVTEAAAETKRADDKLAAETKRAHDKLIEDMQAELQKTKNDLTLQKTKSNAELQKTKKKYECASVGLVFAMLVMMLAYMLS